MKFVTQYIREIAISLGLVVLISGGYYGYRWYVSGRNQAAHAEFAHILEKFENLMSSSDAAAWQELAVECEAGYKNHGSSSYAPYLKIVEAEALLRQNKRAEAIAMLEGAVKALGVSAPFYYLYATKLAFMKYDSSDAQVKEAGDKELRALAGDVRNPQREEVIYYRGLFAFINEGRAQALEAWQPLLSEEAVASVWASLAREHLEYAA